MFPHLCFEENPCQVHGGLSDARPALVFTHGEAEARRGMETCHRLDQVPWERQFALRFF